MKKLAFLLVCIIPFVSNAFKKQISENEKDCSYEINELDEFSGKKKIVTSMYDLTSSEHSGELSIKLSRSGDTKLIHVSNYFALGCTSFIY